MRVICTKDPWEDVRLRHARKEANGNTRSPSRAEGKWLASTRVPQCTATKSLRRATSVPQHPSVCYMSHSLRGTRADHWTGFTAPEPGRQTSYVGDRDAGTLGTTHCPSDLCQRLSPPRDSMFRLHPWKDSEGPLACRMKANVCMVLGLRPLEWLDSGFVVWSPVRRQRRETERARGGSYCCPSSPKPIWVWRDEDEHSIKRHSRYDRHNELEFKNRMSSSLHFRIHVM